MEERLGNNRSTGLNAGALRAWGMLFAVAGIVGQGILQNKMLGVGALNMEQLVQLMQGSQAAMVTATVALVMQALQTVAVPIFAFLLSEGFQHTSDLRKYFFRVLGVAVLAEIPYNLAMQQTLIAFGTCNPTFGMALGLVMLYLFDRFGEKKFTCVVVAVAGIAWAGMLRIDHGIATVLMVMVIRAFRKKPMVMGFFGMAVAALCSAVSVFYLAAPMGFLAIHFYNQEPGEGSRAVNYLFYPATLLAVGLIARFIM